MGPLALRQKALRSFTTLSPDSMAPRFRTTLAPNAGGGQQPILLILRSDCNSIANHPRIRRFERVATDAVALYIDKYGMNTELPWSETDDRTDLS
ncbi:MAG: hypothetical protein MZV49_13055 [Rhodopseudomonas palustris]|nr:hypothetical protein [Rhodopseudomonas palustris]